MSNPEQLIKKENTLNPDKWLKEVRVFAPATVANMICGFDILGFAVDKPGDEVYMQRVEESGVRIRSIQGDDGRLPLDPDKNTVSACVKMLLSHLGLEEEVGIEIDLIKHMPIGSGLGSSSASTVAGLFAINALLGNPLTKNELMPFCVEGERLACGHGHADNVAPALMGGITLIRGYEPLDIINLPVPEDLVAGIVFPQVDVPTRDARQLIKEKVSLKDAVNQWGNIAGLVAGLYRSDYELIGRSMHDVLIEPTRAILIPEFYEMKRIAMEAGVLSFGISGSGPSVVAISKGSEAAQVAVDRIQEHLTANGIESLQFVSAVNAEGPKILS
ncbi:homoserine kinase [Sphingobacterium mizutaii NBRC 14946 = DSM 11724]|uniref:Homoserine kinase n=2 Tax=Sphingobacterium mizutaii TaxID=1010 RepID=A0AAJ5BZ94_9SPHI|nr:homoserine kinase [Sphingobacterium mizutaii]GEM67468.1 homoserine kinase [Sphingobacterium mizutaii NBRC 14946 = DSM 11724]SDL39320.1 homoserine kinase [Sphingobacterium mizutaii]SNV44015.1 Homoserine kinase [Sphingobacterium mizutaii]